MPHDDENRRALVRPRFVWGGHGLTIVGAVVIGLGTILVSWPVALSGCAVLVVGAGLARYGGVASDARAGTSFAEEAEEVAERDVHEGTRPSMRVTDHELRDRAAARTRRTRRILTEASGVPRPPLAPVGAVLLGVVAIGITVSIIRLYPTELRTPAILDGCVATVLALAAIRILAARGAARSTAFVALGLGLLLTVFGVYFSDHASVQGVRVVTGVVTVLCSLACLLSPSRATPA